jgi:pimeloyl-ACP methyl ester carboxylesterase
MILLMQIFFAFLALGQECSLSDRNGFVTVPLVHNFNESQRQNWPRAVELNSKLSQEDKSRALKVYFELAEPYDANKESLLIIGGFYPWQNLNFVSAGPTAPMAFLKNDYNVFEIHFRGSGCSSTTSGLNPLVYTHEMIAADLEAVKKALGISKVNIWASSNGAYVALTFAVLFPDSMGKVLLRDTAIYNPSLKEASQNFENKILPEFLTAAQKEQLLTIKNYDVLMYKKVLKYLGTLFFRREADRTAGVELLGGLSEILLADPKEFVNIIQQLDTKLDQVMEWSEAVYANECLYGEKTDFDINVADVFVVEYVVKRCSPYLLENKEYMLSNLDFRGHLEHLKSPFFIYQGYWDEYLFKELAIELDKQLPNSRIYIDKSAGHGEISKKTFPCFSAVLRGFYKDENSEDYKKFCF